MTIGPVFVVAAISMTGSLESQTVVQWLLDMALVGNLLIVLFKVLPFVVMWLVFAGLYLFIPNTRVTPQAALLGGVFSGTLWQLSQWAYVIFQVGVAKYNAIYGTLAALPIFMVWLYLAWAIVLLGLEVTYAVQNLMTCGGTCVAAGSASSAGRGPSWRCCCIWPVAFNAANRPPSAASIAAELEIPPRLLRAILDFLQRQGLVAELSGADGTLAFPAGARAGYDAGGSPA